MNRLEIAKMDRELLIKLSLPHLYIEQIEAEILKCKLNGLVDMTMRFGFSLEIRRYLEAFPLQEEKEK